MGELRDPMIGGDVGLDSAVESILENNVTINYFHIKNMTRKNQTDVNCIKHIINLSNNCDILFSSTIIC